MDFNYILHNKSWQIIALLTIVCILLIIFWQIKLIKTVKTIKQKEEMLAWPMISLFRILCVLPLWITLVLVAIFTNKDLLPLFWQGIFFMGMAIIFLWTRLYL